MKPGNHHRPHRLVQKLGLAGILTCTAIVIQSACGLVPIKDQDAPLLQPTIEAQIGTNFPVVEITSTAAPTAAISVDPAATVSPSPIPEIKTPSGEEPTAPVVFISSPTPEAANAGPGQSTRIPSPSPTPYIPLANVSIIKPGPQSRVLSPIYLEAAVIPEDYGVVRIELQGEDGRLLYRQVQNYKETKGQRIFLSMSVEFEVPSVAEAGRLSVSVDDSSGRPVSATSVELVMLSMGTAEVFQLAEGREPVVFQQPRLNQLIQGGTVTAAGIVKPANDQPIILELMNDKAEIIGSRQIAVDPSQVGVYVPFQIDIPYTLQHESWTRLVVRQQGTRLPGNVMLSSLLFYLKP